MRWLFLLLPALILTGCADTPQQPQRKAQTRLTDIFRGIDVKGLGKRIWANECAGSVQGLVSWNAGENFPSLGIGHFIWYPAGVQGPFDESLPRFVAYARSRGVQVPAYFNGAAPWSTKAAFEADRSGLANRMRQWLAAHVELQTQFIILRSRAALTKSTERYNGYGWGLLQVLEEMRGTPQGRAATAEFSRAASAVMRRRVANAPAARGEQRWLPGWLNRCKTYQ